MIPGSQDLLTTNHFTTARIGEVGCILGDRFPDESKEGDSE